MDKNGTTKVVKHKMQESRSDRIFHAIVLILTITTFIVITYPLWFVIIASISNSDLVNQGKVIFLPKDIRFVYLDCIEHRMIWSQDIPDPQARRAVLQELFGADTLDCFAEKYFNQ